MSNKNKPQQHKKWLLFIAIPFQMGFVIFIGVLLGMKIDSYLKTAPTFLIIMALLAIALSFYYVFKQLNQINKTDE